jgi:hypothetical protein
VKTFSYQILEVRKCVPCEEHPFSVPYPIFLFWHCLSSHHKFSYPSILLNNQTTQQTMFSRSSTMNTLPSSATEALERALKSAAAPVVYTSQRSMISSASLKRSLADSFDLGDLVDVSETIDFPTIEWANQSDDEDEDECFSPPSAKRRCRGLVRSTEVKSELSLLGSLSRMESSSSLC